MIMGQQSYWAPLTATGIVVELKREHNRLIDSFTIFFAIGIFSTRLIIDS